MEHVTVPHERREAPLTLSDLQFPLPAELIAQEPAARRDRARLLVIDRAADTRAHAHVHNLPQFLHRGDLLIVNDTRVMPARIFGRGSRGGAVELLLVREEPSGMEATQAAPGRVTWLCMGKPAKRLRVGSTASFGGISAKVLENRNEGFSLVAFDDGPRLQQFIAEHGELPLPPYIRRPDGPLPLDRERYQTIFASQPGAIAAPTAGLHFTDELVSSLGDAGVELARITLHVGPGTFRPIRSENPDEHPMDAEWCDIPAATVAAIARSKGAGGRVIAIGTTSTRALESSCATEDGELRAGSRWATAYIRPGYRFRVIDGLFTNFHLPGSTLLLLVSALCGRDRLFSAYAEAIRERYRFYSYGDAMLIL